MISTRTFVVCLSFLSSVGFSAEPVTLKSAVDAALARNAGVKAMDSRVRQAEAGKREASLARLGRLDVVGSMTRGNNPVYVFGSLLEQGRFGAQNFAPSFLNDPPYLTNYKGSLSASVPLFTAFELSSQRQQADYGIQQASLERESAAQQVRWAVLMSVLQVISSRQIGAMLDERIATGSQAIAEATKLRDRGLVLGSDYFVAESVREGMKGWRIQMQSEQTQAQDRLAILVGKPVEVASLRLSDAEFPIEPTEKLLAQAFTHRTELQQARVTVKSAEASAFQARSSLLPQASAFGNLQSNTNDFAQAPSNALVGLRVDVPLGDPTYGPRRTRTAANVESQRQQLKGLEESITLEVTQAAEQYRSAVLRLAAAKETQTRAAQALNLFRPLYRSGRQSVMEVLRAEEGLARSEATTHQMRLAVHAGWAHLQQTLGRLDSSAIETLQSHLEPLP